MAKVPENVLLLHQGEEQLRERSLRMVVENPDLADHLDITERAMDVLDVLRQHYQATDDERAISYLGVRAFNDFATAWKLAASGYYQAAALILRDVIEAVNLVNYFHIDPGKIAAWRCADRRTLKRDFGPAAVRKALDDHAGQGKSGREEIYIKFSTLAGHPTLQGFAMLRPRGMDAQIGPFSDLTALRAVVEEMGMLAAQVGFAFGIYLDTSVAVCSETVRHFVLGVVDYSGNYLGKAYSAAERDEIDRIFRAT
jgi:hypothetical protein